MIFDLVINVDNFEIKINYEIHDNKINYENTELVIRDFLLFRIFNGKTSCK